MVSQRSYLRSEYIRIVMQYLEQATKTPASDFRITRCMRLLLVCLAAVNTTIVASHIDQCLG
jgi:hypothetical protein